MMTSGNCTQCTDISAFAGGRNRGYRLYDLVQRSLFICHVLLAGFNQFRQFIMSLFERDINIGSGLVNIVLEADQMVIQGNRTYQQDKDHTE